MSRPPPPFGDLQMAEVQIVRPVDAYFPPTQEKEEDMPSSSAMGEEGQIHEPAVEASRGANSTDKGKKRAKPSADAEGSPTKEPDRKRTLLGTFFNKAKTKGKKSSMTSGSSDEAEVSLMEEGPSTSTYVPPTSAWVEISPNGVLGGTKLNQGSTILPGNNVFSEPSSHYSRVECELLSELVHEALLDAYSRAMSRSQLLDLLYHSAEQLSYLSMLKYPTMQCVLMQKMIRPFLHQASNSKMKMSKLQPRVEKMVGFNSKYNRDYASHMATLPMDPVYLLMRCRILDTSKQLVATLMPADHIAVVGEHRVRQCLHALSPEDYAPPLNDYDGVELHHFMAPPTYNNFRQACAIPASQRSPPVSDEEEAEASSRPSRVRARYMVEETDDGDLKVSRMEYIVGKEAERVKRSVRTTQQNRQLPTGEQPAQASSLSAPTPEDEEGVSSSSPNAAPVETTTASMETDQTESQAPEIDGSTGAQNSEEEVIIVTDPLDAAAQEKTGECVSSTELPAGNKDTSEDAEKGASVAPSSPPDETVQETETEIPSLETIANQTVYHNENTIDPNYDTLLDDPRPAPVPMEEETSPKSASHGRTSPVQKDEAAASGGVPEGSTSPASVQAERQATSGMPRPSPVATPTNGQEEIEVEEMAHNEEQVLEAEEQMDTNEGPEMVQPSSEATIIVIESDDDEQNINPAPAPAVNVKHEEGSSSSTDHDTPEPPRPRPSRPATRTGNVRRGIKRAQRKQEPRSMRLRRFRAKGVRPPKLSDRGGATISPYSTDLTTTLGEAAREKRDGGLTDSECGQILNDTIEKNLPKESEAMHIATQIYKSLTSVNDVVEFFDKRLREVPKDELQSLMHAATLFNRPYRRNCAADYSTTVDAAAEFTYMTFAHLAELMRRVSREGQVRPVLDFKSKDEEMKMRHHRQASVGLSPTDLNAVIYPVGKAAIDQNVASQQRVMMDPFFSGPGTYYHLVFSDEVKRDVHKEYPRYCREIGILCDILQLFGVPARLSMPTGNVIVDFANITATQADLFSTWLHYLLLAEPEHQAAGYGAAHKPDTFPGQPFPEELCPADRPEFAGSPDYLASDADAIYQQFRRRVRDSPVVADYDSESRKQLLALQCREELAGTKNPFEFGLSSTEVQDRVSRLNTHLHGLEARRRRRVITRLFPAEMLPTPQNRCEVPTCSDVDCPQNREGWAQLVKDIDSFVEREREPADLKPLCYSDARPSRQQRFFPRDYFDRLTEEVVNSVPFGTGRYEGNSAPPLMEHLLSREWQLTDVVALCTLYCRRVYSIYQNSGGKRRSVTTYPECQVPLCFYDLERKRLLSLRHHLPTTLSESYLGRACFPKN
ncbi:Oidioi.mRNA.OKI2018_I69.PAR.g11948.t1.cds [Oikopleura dioica]|uniref:Oidioi.mRNA.OKI2018_I69.PAR.g11948.t1.cds n=1 Tax=Oikopleura dioica TaxID=34765 RepID=A0ABN7S4S8_OIKDI|nr:Oidioi.mRNA.OKI2018_I69.PAR.g11948.t1.cds [Oikopleura dioica]